MNLPEIFLPGDDRTVLIQVGVVAVVAAVSLFLARRNRDLLVFIAGMTVLLLGLIGIRAVH